MESLPIFLLLFIFNFTNVAANLCKLVIFPIPCDCYGDYKNITAECENFKLFLDFERNNTFQVMCQNDNEALDDIYKVLDAFIFVDIRTLNIHNCKLSTSKSIEEYQISWFPTLKNITIVTNFSIYENIFSESFNYVENIGITWSIIENGFQHGFSDNLFKNLTNLKNLQIKADKSYQSFQENMFIGSNNIEILSVNVGFDETIRNSVPENIFQNLYKVKKLDLSNNYFSEVPDKLFESLANILDLDLSFNELHSLPQDIFKFNGNLRKISLNYNKFQNFSEFLFDNQRVHVLDLSGNLFLNLENITNGIFRNMDYLKYLDLSNINVRSLPMGIFSNLIDIETIVLKNNHLEIFKSVWIQGLYKLQTLSLQNNRIKNILIPSNMPTTNLKNLNISCNCLFTFNYNWSQLSLQYNYIDVSKNEIRTLNFENIFDIHNKNIQNCSLKFNSNPLKSIEILEFSHSNNIRINIDLNYNKLDCDCDIYNFTKFLEDKNQELFDIQKDTLFCNNVTFENVNKSNLICKGNNLSCPGNCDCIFIGESRDHRIYCSGLTEFPKNLFPNVRESYRNITFIAHNNYIRKLPDIREVQGYDQIVEMDLSNNSITAIGVNSIPPNIISLDLSGNLIPQFSRSVIHTFEDAMDIRGFKLKFSGNPINCICANCRFLCFFFQKWDNITDADLLRCENYGQQMIAEISPDFICIMERLPYIIVGLLVPLSIAVLTTFFFKYKMEIKVWLFANNLCLWYVSEEDLDKDKKFDAFISYSHKDEHIVIRLHEFLENGDNPYKLCLHFRDWIPGEFIPNQIVKSVQESRRTIFVLTKSFIESVWSRLEFRTAHVAALNEGRTRVIVILCEDFGNVDDLDEELKVYLKTNTYIKWDDKWFWERLKYALPHRRPRNCFLRKYKCF